MIPAPMPIPPPWAIVYDPERDAPLWWPGDYEEDNWDYQEEAL